MTRCLYHPWIEFDEKRGKTCPEVGPACGGRLIMESVRIPGMRALTAASMIRSGMAYKRAAKLLHGTQADVSRLAKEGERALRWIEGTTREDL